MIYFAIDIANWASPHVWAQSRMIKIGYSRDPQARIAALQTGSANPLEVIATCQGGRMLESIIHGSYRLARFDGEWFYSTPELMRLVNELRIEQGMEALK